MPNQNRIAGPEIHVASSGNDLSGLGTPEAPFATVSRAAESHAGSVILVHSGVYSRITLSPACSGTEDAPTVIRAAEGEHVVIRPGRGTGIRLENAEHIALEGLEVEGGTHGIRYESTREAGIRPLRDIAFRNCTVHGIRGTHGICVYARNDLAPVRDLTIEGCEVFDCECGSSESVVVNGNVDGFLIASNVVHDNNNIGIDMIGFEGTAKRPDGAGGNPYEFDCARNGVCRDNVVYNICTEGNMAYFDGVRFDRCAGGIYVDGGQDIEIFRNFVFNCDIGIEVATEHSPDDNPLFRVTGVRVHDNVVADCRGWAGLCFGGYARHLGFTENCGFDHNTLVNNAVQIAVQRSRNNRIHANLILGGDTGVLYNDSCRPEDLINDLSGNAAAGLKDVGSWKAEYGVRFADTAEAADGFRSLLPDCGSRFVPERKKEKEG